MLGSRVLNIETTKNILDVRFKTDFEKDRYQLRVDMINNYS
jgi:ribose 5-phosphate isomerase RpiB